MWAVLWALAACEDGTASPLAYTTALTTYNAESALYGWNIAAQSEGCTLPVTPSSNTFSIWGYIGTAQAALAVIPGLPEEEAYHLARALQASSRWYRSFSGNLERSNVEALSAIAEMECHAGKAAYHACEVEPRTFACAANTQYHTWLRVAQLLSELIVETYGDRCGTPMLSDAEVEALFSERFGAILASLPPAGVRDVAERTARTVVAWAWKGVCDERGGVCPVEVKGGATPEQLSAVDALRKQSELAWAAALVSLPEAAM